MKGSPQNNWFIHIYCKYQWTFSSEKYGFGFLFKGTPRRQWGMSGDIQGVTAEFLQNPTVKTICTALGWECSTRQTCEESEWERRWKGGQGRTVSLVSEWSPENILISKSDKPEVLRTGPTLYPANNSAGPSQAEHVKHKVPRKKKRSFKKGSTDCPLQNDYCTYSCITMF